MKDAFAFFYFYSFLFFPQNRETASKSRMLKDAIAFNVEHYTPRFFICQYPFLIFFKFLSKHDIFFIFMIFTIDLYVTVY